MTMSDGNMELVHRFYASWSDRNIDAIMEFVAPDVEFDWTESRSPYQGIYRGRDGIMRFWRDQAEAWEEFRIELVEAIECGPGVLVAVTSVRGRGRGSGIDLEAGGAAIWRFRDGAIAGVKLFQGKEEALAAAGLQEEADRR
jgi:ketosteroid isomerase-like protein